jgi:regulator of cell morphogenesis and NO signaling
VRYINPSWTVNDLLRIVPESAATLNSMGIDTCCGGSQLVAEAAAAAGTTVDAIMAGLATDEPSPAADACSIRR